MMKFIIHVVFAVLLVQVSVEAAPHETPTIGPLLDALDSSLAANLSTTLPDIDAAAVLITTEAILPDRPFVTTDSPELFVTETEISLEELEGLYVDTQSDPLETEKRNKNGILKVNSKNKTPPRRPTPKSTTSTPRSRQPVKIAGNKIVTSQTTGNKVTSKPGQKTTQRATPGVSKDRLSTPHYTQSTTQTTKPAPHHHVTASTSISTQKPSNKPSNKPDQKTTTAPAKTNGRLSTPVYTQSSTQTARPVTHQVIPSISISNQMSGNKPANKPGQNITQLSTHGTHHILTTTTPEPREKKEKFVNWPKHETTQYSKYEEPSSQTTTPSPKKEGKKSKYFRKKFLKKWLNKVPEYWPETWPENWLDDWPNNFPMEWPKYVPRLPRDWQKRMWPNAPPTETTDGSEPQPENFLEYFAKGSSEELTEGPIIENWTEGATEEPIDIMTENNWTESTTENADSVENAMTDSWAENPTKYWMENAMDEWSENETEDLQDDGIENLMNGWYENMIKSFQALLADENSPKVNIPLFYEQHQTGKSRPRRRVIKRPKIVAMPKIRFSSPRIPASHSNTEGSSS